MIIIRTPNCFPQCSSTCLIERGTIFLADGDLWSKIRIHFSFHNPLFDDKYYLQPFVSCLNFNLIEFIKHCEIIDRDPNVSIVNFVQKINNQHLYDKIVKIYHDELCCMVPQ